MDLFASLYEFRTYLLIGAAVLVLIGLAGGARLKVKDLELGPVELPVRVVAALLGLVCLGVIGGIPTPEPNTIEASGTIEFNSQDLDINNMKVQLLPRDTVYETEVQPTGHGAGTFKFPKKVTKGYYTLFIVQKSQISDNKDISLHDKRQIIIREVESTPSGHQFEIRPAHLLNDSLTRYRTARIWIEKAKIIRNLSSYAWDDQILREGLSNILQDVSKSIHEKELPVFVLSEIADYNTKEVLEQILVNSDTNIFVRLRAAGYVMQLFDSKESKEFLLSHLNHQSLGVRTAAAVNLSRRATNKSCVIEQLVQGLTIKEPYAREIVRESLVTLSGQSFGANEYAKWQQWWSGRKQGEFEACPMS
jgi:hypothetical protein